MNKPDHMRAAIEAKVFDALAPSKWKTLVVSTRINEKGIVLRMGTSTSPDHREYQVSIKRIGRGAK